MKRILFVIDSLNSGGAEKSLISLLSLFDYSKYKVDLLLFSKKGLYLPLLPKQVHVLEVPDSIKSYEEGIRKLIVKRRFKTLFNRVMLYFAHRQNLRKKRKHHAQISWRWMADSIAKLEPTYDAAIAYSQGIPTYFVAEKVHAEKKFCWINTDYRAAQYDKRFDAPFYARFQNIVAVSDVNKEVFTSEMPEAAEKTKVVYDIVSTAMISAMAIQKGGFEHDFDGTRILTIGRLVESKGYDLAIEACIRLKENGYRFVWCIIGEGPLKEELERSIKSNGLNEHMKLLGTFNNPYTFLKQSDIYVQPSRFEGFGLAIAEARCLLKPVVATNFPVVHNQIKDRWNGLIVQMSGEALYEGIRELIDDSDLRDSIIQHLKLEDVGTENEIHKVYELIESNFNRAETQL